MRSENPIDFIGALGAGGSGSRRNLLVGRVGEVMGEMTGISGVFEGHGRNRVDMKLNRIYRGNFANSPSKGKHGD